MHIFRLTQFSKIIFLDADVLPIRPLSHLFSLPHEFSASPDVGWPDIFNSGVLVLSPGEEKFTQLTDLLTSKGSWDGGDQGILNEWRGGDWNRLSFTYNTTPTAAYTSVLLFYIIFTRYMLTLRPDMRPHTNGLVPRYPQFTSSVPTSLGAPYPTALPSPANQPPLQTPFNKHMITIHLSTDGMLCMISIIAPISSSHNQNLR